jgi:hypothetical protein
MLKNLTCFRLASVPTRWRRLNCFYSWILSNNDPDWLINSLTQTVARLPHLTELDVQSSEIFNASEARIPLGLFSNLSKLSVGWDPEDASIFISEMSTVIANSPNLKRLEVSYYGGGVPPPTLSDLFAKTPTENPLCLGHLSLTYIDATVNQETVLHLMQLTSFCFYNDNDDPPVARSIWTSFLVNNIKLSDVEISGYITKEMISYLSSFSGLKRLVARGVRLSLDMTVENLKNMLITVVLPKHVNSLQTLDIYDGLVVKLSIMFSVLFFDI